MDDLHEQATNAIGVECGFATSPERRQMRELLVVPLCVEAKKTVGWKMKLQYSITHMLTGIGMGSLSCARYGSLIVDSGRGSRDLRGNC